MKKNFIEITHQLQQETENLLSIIKRYYQNEERVEKYQYIIDPNHSIDEQRKKQETYLDH